MPGAQRSEPGRGHPIYGISVAAELTGVGPQALRDYETKGLLDPHRTEGGTRRYSRDDIDRVHAISDALGNGANLAAVRQILFLEAEVKRLASDLQAARAVIEVLEQEGRKPSGPADREPPSQGRRGGRADS